MKILLLNILFLVYCSLHAYAEPTIMVHTRVVGEPINRPIELSIKLRCNRHNIIELHKKNYCEYEKIEINKNAQSLLVHTLSYDPDSGKCEIPEVFELSYVGKCL